jgi:hypothetical protein
MVHVLLRLDDERAPDFARGVEIRRKPGYDPAKLFFDPSVPLVRPRATLTVLRKKDGLRAPLTVVPLDPTCVRAAMAGSRTTRRTRRWCSARNRRGSGPASTHRRSRS